MDESNAFSTDIMIWDDGSSKILCKCTSKGECMVIIHNGGENGFVPNALKMWKADNNGDYHNQINNTNYTKLLEENLIPNVYSTSSYQNR